MNAKKRAGSRLKLDEMLRAGASGKRPAIDIDKAVSSTTHRLIKEAITFTKENKCIDNSQQFRDSGFSILDSQNEASAMRRIAKLIMSKEIPQNALKLPPQVSGIRKKMKFKKKNKVKFRKKKKGPRKSPVA